MRPQRRFLAGEVYLITARAAQGLPFPARRLVKKIIKGIMAKGQSLYPVTICHYQFMGNHFHLIVLCKCSKTMMLFYKYLKAELARAMNKLSGKRGVLWYGRCDATVLLTAEDVIEKSAYLYTNPQAAHLVERIDEWPGVSSWSAFTTGRYEERCEWVPVREIDAGVIKNAEKHKEYTLKVSPFAWLESKDYRDCSRVEAKQEIVSRVRTKELELCRQRRQSGRGVVGRRDLERQGYYRPYHPKKFGRRVLCICHDVKLRKEYIEAYRDFVERCRVVYKRWSKGNFSIEYPPGAFPPPLYELAA